jgi:hypothetical protein
MAQRRSRAKTIVADVGDSECFTDLRFRNGEAFATFARDGSSYSYEMSRADFREWMDADSLGKFFNSFIR